MGGGKKESDLVILGRKSQRDRKGWGRIRVKGKGDGTQGRSRWKGGGGGVIREGWVFNLYFNPS